MCVCVYVHVRTCMHALLDIAAAKLFMSDVVEVQVGHHVPTQSSITNAV